MQTPSCLLLLLCLSQVNAWPWPDHHEDRLTMEGARGQSANPWSSHSQFAGRGSNFESEKVRQQADVGGASLCRTVVSSTAPNPAAESDSKDTAIHFCPSSGTLCYFSALRRCCSGASDNVQLGEAREVQVGSQMVTVRYLYSGGFGSSDPLRVCALFDTSIEMCPSTCSCNTPELCEPTGMCLDNSLQPPEDHCDPVLGCQCQDGYLTPDCCECDITGKEHPGRLFYESGEECLEICLEFCVRPGPVGCLTCRTGYKEPGCCECASGYRMSNGICCPEGEEESAGMCCPIGQVVTNGVCCPAGEVGSNGICCPVGQSESNGICCPSGQEESFGRCCPIGQILSNDVCCPAGQVGSNGICCPSGQTESNGVCCPSGQVGSNGRCCPIGQIESNGICCPSGQHGSNGICCPIGQSESNKICCPSGQQESNGICCPTGQTGSNGICCPANERESNGICCPPNKVGDSVNKVCRSTVTCGENQNIYFLLDITQTFTVKRAYPVIRALQLLKGTLDNNEANIHMAVVLYPYIYTSAFAKQKPDRDSKFLFGLQSSCEDAAKELEDLAKSLAGDQSEGTNVTTALKFLDKNIDSTRSAAVVTIASGFSDGYGNPLDKTTPIYPPTLIGRAMNEMQTDKQGIRFFAAGDRDSSQNAKKFNLELMALSENDVSRLEEMGPNDPSVNFISKVIDLLENGNILCSDQAVEIKKFLEKSDLDTYTKCIKDRKPKCYTDEETCSIGRISNLSLESEIIQAVEQVLLHRGGAQGGGFGHAYGGGK